ncbi:Nlrc3, partial [Symbiodinium necroappetens]
MLQDILQDVVPDRWELRTWRAASAARIQLRSRKRLERGDAWSVCNFIQRDAAQRLRQSKRYDLAQKQGLADFLKDADIRLVHTPGCSVVRADFIRKLDREGQRLPRRQEAESAYVDCRTALVTHEEVQVWADGKAPDGTQVISVSHCWEALTGKEWLFIDYVSLHQFQ